MMKIISVSNFDFESYEQWVVAENIRNPDMAKTMCDALCAQCDGNSPTYYRVVEDGHRLWRGMREMVGDTEWDYARDLAWMVN